MRTLTPDQFKDGQRLRAFETAANGHRTVEIGRLYGVRFMRDLREAAQLPMYVPELGPPNGVSLEVVGKILTSERRLRTLHLHIIDGFFSRTELASVVDYPNELSAPANLGYLIPVSKSTAGLAPADLTLLTLRSQQGTEPHVETAPQPGDLF